MNESTILLLFAVAAGGYLLWSMSQTAAASAASPSTSAASGTDAANPPVAGSTAAPPPSTSPAPNVLPPPAVALPPAIPIETGVPIQHAGEIAGLYSLISSAAAPGALYTAPQWDEFFSNAWYSYAMMTSGLPTMGTVPDATAVLKPLYPQFDGTQKMSLETYWSAMSNYLKANQGLSGVRSWAV